VEIKGTPKVYIDTGGSGNHVNRHFCGDCGSAIMSIMDINPAIAFIKGGLFRSFGVDLPRPTLQLWVRRAEPWEVLLDGTKNIE